MLKMYDFVCRDCGNTFEKLTENVSIVECPHCGSGACTHLPSSPAIKATGQGVYSTRMFT
jgi:putative FmdB family regulatory protein